MTALTQAQLSPREQRFVEEYLVDLNGKQAAIRAGYAERSAEVTASRLLRRAKVAAAVADGQAERAEETGITAARVLQELWDIATADPNDLVQYRVGPCPACWVAEGEEPPAEPDKRRDPDPDCPSCAGEGVGRVYVPDTRTLTGPARRLYAGVKTTKEGLEVKMRSQDAALGRVFEHLGMGVKRLELGGANGGPIVLQAEPLAARLAKLTPDERAMVRSIALKLEGGS